MILKSLLNGVKTVEINGSVEKEIRAVCYDSRKVTKSTLFICISGFKVDGHNFALSAVENGAEAVIVEKKLDLPKSVTQIVVEDSRKVLAIVANNLYEHPSKEFTLIGVTGTNGKTSTTFLTKQIFEKVGQKVGLIGTIENRIGNIILEAERTTPESLELQELFVKMKENQVDSVVMEVSSHSLDLYRVEGCNFDVGIFTNLTQDHLDFHGTMENYLQAKAKLFTKCKYGVINADDPAAKTIRDTATCEVITYGIDQEADVKAENISITAQGVTFEVVVKNERVPIAFAIPGRFSVYNALAAFAAAYVLNIPIISIREGLESVKGVAGRCEAIENSKGIGVIVDYAHTPDGLENILNTVSEFANGKKITVFGCGGDRDRTKRPIMGEIAAKLSDFVVMTSDNPRTEDPEKILDDVEVGLKKHNTPYVRISDRKEAIRYAIKMAEVDDIVTIAGKGHETYQILKDRTIDFDDKKIASEFLREE